METKKAINQELFSIGNKVKILAGNGASVMSGDIGVIEDYIGTDYGSQRYKVRVGNIVVEYPHALLELVDDIPKIKPLDKFGQREEQIEEGDKVAITIRPPAWAGGDKPPVGSAGTVIDFYKDREVKVVDVSWNNWHSGYSRRGIDDNSVWPIQPQFLVVIDKAFTDIVPLERFGIRQGGILDYPQETLDEDIWDLSGKTPVLRQEVKEQILGQLYLTLSNNGLVYFEDWITAIYFVGSSATYQWEEDSDIDITCIVNTDLFTEKEQRPDLSDEEIMALLKGIANKQANGELLNGTNHPINYFFRDNELDEDVTDAIYDIRKDVWIKFPSKTEISDFREVINKAVSWARKIDLDKGELWRDTIDYEKLQRVINRLQGNDREKVKERLQEKVNEISDGLEILIQTGKTIHKERLQAFEEKLENGEVPSKNWLPENIIYKFLERWNYIQLLKDLKEIDTIEEIPKLKKYLTNRKRYGILSNRRGDKYGDDGETWKGEIPLQRELQGERIAESVQKVSQNLTRAQQVSNIIYPTVDDILNVADTIVFSFGQEVSLWGGRGPLEAAIGRMQSSFSGQEFYPTLFEKAAILVHSITSTHPFSDGNKRISTMSGLWFLEMNGIKPNANVDEEELQQIIWGVSEHKIEYTDLVEWLKRNYAEHIQPLDKFGQYLPNSVPEVQIYTIQDRFQDDPKLGQYVSSHKSEVPGVYKVYDIYRKDGYTVYTVDPMNKMVDMVLAVNFETYQEAVDYVKETMVKRAQHGKLKPLSEFESVTLEDGTQVLYAMDWHDIAQGLIGVKPEEFTDNMVMLFFVSGGTFHMNGVFFPIDIAFLDEEGKILKLERMIPNESYVPAPSGTAYALEANVNWYSKKGLKVGDNVPFIKMEEAEPEDETERWVPLSDWKYIIGNDGTKILLADTWETLSQGIMKSKPQDFPEDTVMLFLIGQLGYNGPFHMRDCLFSIHISFLDKDFRILKIYTAAPETSGYEQPPNSEYALETNIGWFDKKGLKEGDIVSIFTEEQELEEQYLEEEFNSEDYETRESQKQKYALITGFDKFAGYVKNPSFEVARKLEGKTIAGYKIQIAKLPVEYGTSAQMVTDIVKEIKPDVVIALGLAFYGKIAIEATAYKCESTVEQISGLKETPEQVASNLPVSNILQKWKSEEIPGIKGYNPGAFVCEHIMYTLYTLEDLSKKGFIHVPRPEEMSLEVMVKAVIVALEETAKVVEQEEMGKTAQTEIKFAQWSYDDVMNKRVRNEYYVSVSNEYLVQEDNSMNPASDYPEHMLPDEVWGKIVAKYYDYPSAIAHAEIIYDGIDDAEKPSKETINSVFVEDYVSGELFSGQVAAFLANMGTVDEEWEYSKSASESAGFTDGKLKEIGYPKGINTTKGEIDRMGFGVTIKPLETFGQLVSHDMAGTTIQVGDTVSFPMEDPKQWPPAVIKGILQKEDEPHDLIIVIREEEDENIEDCVGSDEVLKVEDTLVIKPLDKFGVLTPKFNMGDMVVALVKSGGGLIDAGDEGTITGMWESGFAPIMIYEVTAAQDYAIGRFKEDDIRKQEEDYPIEPLEVFGQTPIYIRNKSKFQPGELVVIKTDAIFPLFGPIKVGDKAEYRGDDEFLMVSGAMTGYNFKVTSDHAQNRIFESFTPEIEPLEVFG